MANKKEDPRAHVWAALKAKEITRVELEFSGGNDEGRVDNIHFLDGEHAVEEITDCDIVEGLEAPIHEQFDGFDGEPEVTGTCTWDVIKKTITITGSRSEWVSFNPINVK